MKTSRAKRSGLVASTLVLGLVLAACGSSSSSPSTTSSGSTGTQSSGGSGAPIKIALIASVTGADASIDGDAPIAFTAAVDAQNAAGGINGHKIDPIVLDDQTSPSLAPTTVQQAISDGVTGIVANSPVFFLGAKYAQQAGIPVTGNSGDGSEWGMQPNTNMFPADNNNTNPAVPWSKLLGNFLKSRGGTNLATYGYSISPSSVHATYGSASSALAAGLKVGVMDTTVQFGTESFGNEALAAKSAQIDSLSSQMDINSNLALLTAMKQNGLNPKVVSFDTGYQTSLIKSNIWSSVQGVYFGTSFRPWNIPANAGTTTMQQTLTKYAGFKAGQFPDYAQYESYLGAELMIQGLLKAGANPTPASTIKALRSITAWNGDGILPTTVNFTNNFGYNALTGCEWYEQAKPNTFVPISATPMCAPYIPGSTSFNPPKI